MPSIWRDLNLHPLNAFPAPLADRVTADVLIIVEKFESKDVPGTPGTRATAFDVSLSLGCSGAIVRSVRGFDGSSPPSERKNEVNSHQTFYDTFPICNGNGNIKSDGINAHLGALLLL